MPPLKRVRIAILPVLALAAWGFTIWGVTFNSGPDRDDIIPAALAVVLSVWAIVRHERHIFWRESQAVKFDHAVEAVAEGFRAGAETVLGDGQRRKDG